jgi:hypothetical protein
MTTAGDIFAGHWSGEMKVLVPCLYNDWRWGEIWDRGTATDNGHILLCAARDRWVHPDTIIFLTDAERGTPEEDIILRVRTPDSLFRLEEEHLVYRHTLTRCEAGGQLMMVENWSDEGGSYLTVWVRDARRKWVIGLTAHDEDKHAHDALRWLAKNYQPPANEVATKSNYDRQKAKVYAWEAALERDFPQMKEKLPIEGCRSLAAAACEGVTTPPQVEFSERLQSKCYWRSGIVMLAAWGMTRGTTLHETAHHLVSRTRKGAKRESHCPAFVGTFMRLLHAHAGVPMAAMVAEAESRGVEFTLD